MTLTQTQQSLIVEAVRAVAREEILPRFRNLSADDIAVKSRADDLVTEADLHAEARLRAVFSDAFPQALVVGEEAIAADPALRTRIAGAELALIIDPVDGTWNFARGLPAFGVIVSATRFGAPVFGLHYDPVMDDWMIADMTGPTTHVFADGRQRSLSTSAGGAPQEVAGYMHYALMPQPMREALAPLLPRIRRSDSLRCSCHEYRMLASGAVDFCLSTMLNPWDHAAGVLLCTQAGGVSRMLDGQDYNAHFTSGLLLSAATEETWLGLRDLFVSALASDAVTSR
ncbi:inositol monophosphatase family protein [Mesobacterium pallidum]|uniref:inositol monophosphatase family protein n=1 Tax=Mesobacterium pallidum TaxID=2872037 RepID=UPI001EE2C52C|nr:inositol monophosphatase [Mesobacterium pallidum]